MDRHFLHRQRHQEQPSEGERARVLAELAAGRPLADILDGETAVVDAMRLRELLEALPWVDRIHAGQLMNALHIGEHCATGELSDLQRQRLRQLFPPATAA